MVTEYTLNGMTPGNLAYVARSLTDLTTRLDGGRSDRPVSTTVAVLPGKTIWTMTVGQRIGVRKVIVTITH